MSNHLPKDCPLFANGAECVYPCCTCKLEGHSNNLPRPKPLPEDSAGRKEVPIFSGVMAYFPDALAAIAAVSFRGNQKHNPGEPLHWSRDKSSDHLDCIARHLLEAGGKDADGNWHSALLAWRALANLQLEMELLFDLPKPRGAK